MGVRFIFVIFMSIGWSLNFEEGGEDNEGLEDEEDEEEVEDG